MNKLAETEKKYSLHKKHIIKKNEHFNHLFKYGKPFSSKYFLAFILQSDFLQVGITAQKGYKNKVQRNRLKRVTKELWRKSSEKPNTCHLVILAKLEALDKNYKQLEIDFNELLLVINKDLHT
jgi:ribonuclease P protein component